MNSFIKAAALCVLAASTVLPTMQTAQAGDWNGRRHYDRGYDRGDAVALGALGLATGVIIGGAIASQPRYYNNDRVYVDPEPEYYEPRPVYRPRPVYQPRPVVVDNYGSYEPWSQSWYRYCSQRYRSFNPETGTFRGYDGRDYFCNAG